MTKLPLVVGSFCLFVGTGWANSVLHTPGEWQAAKETTALLYFTDQTSVLCRELDEDVWRDTRLGKATQDYFRVQVDAKVDRNLDLFTKFAIPEVPTLVVWDGRKEVRRLERESDREVVLAFLQGRVLAQAAGSAPGAGHAASGGSTSGVDLTCGSDPVGDNTSGNFDITQVCAGWVGNNFQVQVMCAESPELKSAANYNVFVDTDGNEETGAQTGGGSGADRLIQGAFVYKFSGSSPAEWKWDRVGAANAEVRGKALILSAPKDVFGFSAPPRVWVGSQTPDFKPADWAPQTGPLTVGDSGHAPMPGGPASNSGFSSAQSQNPAGSSVQMTSGAAPELKGEAKASLEDAKGDAPPLFDIHAIHAAMDGDKILIQFVLGGKPPISSLHIFFNADGQDATGYTDGAHPGAEFMIEGTTFYKHKADAGTGWGWDASGTVTPAPVQQGNVVMYTISRSRIGLTKDASISVWFATTDATWNTADTAPDTGGWMYPQK
jgi:hypothetical protein